MPKIKRKSYFQLEWLRKPEFSSWLQSVQNGSDRANCKLCSKEFDVGNMGISAVFSHLKSDKHLRLLQENEQLSKSQISLNVYMVPTKPADSNTSEAPSAGDETASDETRSAVACSASTVTNNVALSAPTCSSATSITSSAKSGVCMASFVQQEQVTKAEVMWTLKSVCSKYSYNSVAGLNDLFQSMFPDSEIARKFQLSYTKMAYTVRFGLAPHFLSELQSKIKKCHNFVLAFDESLNRVSQHGQMDVHVRFFDDTCNKVTTRYLGSQFLGHASADDLVSNFLEAVKDLNHHKLIQISMDGPNVNWSFLQKIKTKFESERDPDDPILLDLGSCSLHIIHGAFQTGSKASGFDINHLLISLYYLFHDSPARRDDYSRITGSSTFPLKFCAHRWLENGRVASRAIEIWEHVKKYVSDVKKKPDSKSFITVKQSVADPLTVAKLSFFVSVVSHVQRFLTIFQGDRPLLPFLNDEVHDILRSLMSRFIKADVMKESNTALKLCKVDSEDKKNHKDYKSVDIGFAANAILQSGSGSDLQKMEFRMGCIKFLAAMTGKLLNRNPLQYSLVRNLSCLCPRNVATLPEKNTAAFRKVLEYLLMKLHFTAAVCDEAGRQFEKFCDDHVKKNCNEFMSFQESKHGTSEADRLDEFYVKHLKESSDYAELWSVVKFCLTLSHGQAAVESGFSVNKEMLVENQAEATLVAQRHVHDAIISAGGLNSVQITPNLMMSVRNARGQYQAYLDSEKIKKLNEGLQAVNKRKNEELSAMKDKRRRLEIDCVSMQTDADKLAEQAETTSKLTLIAKSNALRRAVKMKRDEIKKLDETIASFAEKI